jgi:cystathionine beta-lyase/cystathionine gamma-synthase
MGYRFSFVNMGDAANVEAAITPETKAIWIETPSNPLLNLVEIKAITAIAQKAGLLTIADNTFLSPFLQRPFEHGVDVVIHSTTKYLNGHSDVVGGCVVTRHDEQKQRIAYIVNALGLACSPFDAWLVLRGIKTLGPRMEAHQKGAMALARMLDEHAPARSLSRARCTVKARAPKRPLSRSIAPRFPRTSLKASFSVTKKARSPAP